MSIAIKPLAAWVVRERAATKTCPLVTPELAFSIATFQPHFGWWLPTQTVINKPTMVVPNPCNYYCVSAEFVRKILNLSVEQWPSVIEVPVSNGFNRHPNYAYLVERYADYGDDGHTDMCRAGFALLTAEDFEVYKKYKTDYNEGLRVEEVYIDNGEDE